MATAGLQVLLLLTASAAAEAWGFGGGNRQASTATAQVSNSLKMPVQTLKKAGQDYYTVAVEVGTPAKSVHLMVDTSSPVSWVDYTKTPALVNSTTAVNKGAELEYSSAKGQAAGIAFEDKFCLKGGSQLCIAKQHYILCDQVAGFPRKNNDFNGMLGLGAPTIFTEQLEGQRVPGKSFLQEANASKFASKFAFGMSLVPSNSFVSFGELKDVLADAPQGSAPSVTVPLTEFEGQRLNWNVPMSIAIGKEQTVAVKDLKVKLDSGSNLITAPASASEYLTSMIQMLEYRDTDEAVGNMIVTLQREARTFKTMFGAFEQEISSKGASCSNTDTDGILCYCNVTLKPLTFILEGEGGKTAKITLNSRDLLKEITKTKAGDPVCQVNIQEGREGFWTVGTAFLKKAYVVHDVAAGKVTFFPNAAASAALLAEAEPSATLDLDHAGREDALPVPGPSMIFVFGSTLMGVLMGSIATCAALRIARRGGITATGRTALLSA